MEQSLAGALAHAQEFLRLQDQNNIIIGFVVVSAAAVYFLYAAVDRFYKLHLHPLAKFPGPKKACLSQKWLLRVSEQGNPEHVFEKLHEKYNSRAIRIGPNELHIDDVKLYKDIYNQTSTYVKHDAFYAGFNTPHSVFAEHVPSLHKERRRRLNPFFSRRAMTQLEGLLKDKIQELGRRLDTQKGPYNIFNAIRCTTVDIISHYSLGKPLGQLEKSDQGFNGEFLQTFDLLSNVLWKFMYKPTFRSIITSIPPRIAKAASKETRFMLALYDACYSAAIDFKKSPPQSSYGTILSSLVDLGEKEMGAEAVDLLVAGSDTTAYTLAVGITQIGKNSRVKDRLVKALDARAINAESLPSLLELEQTEYLNATVREAVRFAMATPGRLPRTVPSNAPPLVVDGQVIPPGSVIGMSAYTMNFSKELWGEDARAFNPDRWLGAGGKALDANMCSFSKGLRTCIGQNLAYAEMHYILAYLFRKYDVDLVDKEAEMEVFDRFTSYVNSHAVMVHLGRREAQ
ncbi:trichodiene oxygenase cytochrome P450 [Fusarium mundagurra]|uniref:Trichodiene oxygenase cytochrome P450 n=1 Tax=Fusarium mundagurra TaxID=1567541 RepID=A0A8H5XWP7_9HYPO|nr:trichodiene oxygenase cytochrome P450 [Fusarium mundagurra]